MTKQNNTHTEISGSEANAICHHQILGMLFVERFMQEQSSNNGWHKLFVDFRVTMGGTTFNPCN